MLIGMAYCKVFSEGDKDTAEIRKSLETLSEEKVSDLPEYFQTLAFEMDNEL